MWLLKLLAIFVQISMLLAQIGHPKCGRSKTKRGGSGGTGHSTGPASTTLEHAWAVAIVLPNKECLPKPKPVCDEYGYTDEGYSCDGDDGGGDDDYEDIADLGGRTDGISGECPKTKMHCSGSILDEQTIVTAAHCFVGENGRQLSVDEIKEMTVIVGANDPTNEEDLKKRKRFVQQIKINPGKVLLNEKYDKATKAAYYDVAIVRVRGRFRFRNSVWPICIPEVASDELDEWLGKGLTLAAYGENTKNDVENDAILTAATFIGEKSTLCSGIYDISTFENEYEQIHTSLPRLFKDNTIFCARVPGTDAGTCPGDSGGTLLTTQFIESIGDSRSVIAAVVHGSIKPCDGTRFPSIFVRLDNFEILSWIIKEVFPKLEKDGFPKKKKQISSGGGGAPAGPVEGTLTDDTFKERECARRATSSVNSPCLEWKSKEEAFDGPVEQSDGGKCLYNCKPNDGMFCRVNYEKKLFNGKTKGLCFLNKKCFGTPDACKPCIAKCF